MTEKMKPSVSFSGRKQKGSAFELWACREFTKWITGVPKPELFWRSTGSGAKFTVDRKKGLPNKGHGDIMAVDSMGEFLTDFFFFELKSYQDLSIEDFFWEKGTLYRFWADCVEKARSVPKEPALIFKRNLRKPLMVLSFSGWRFISDWAGPIKPVLVVHMATELGDDDSTVFIVGFDEFLASCNSESLQQAIAVRKGVSC
jgi:hypothetical protein